MEGTELVGKVLGAENVRRFLEDGIGRVAASKRAEYGALIGRIEDGGAGVVHVLRAVPVPPEQGEEAVWWAEEHARQLVRATAGGISVVGVYVLAPPSGSAVDLTRDDVLATMAQNVCAQEAKLLPRAYSGGLFAAAPTVLLNSKASARKVLCKRVVNGVPKVSEIRWTIDSHAQSASGPYLISIECRVPISLSWYTHSQVPQRKSLERVELLCATWAQSLRIIVLPDPQEASKGEAFRIRAVYSDDDLRRALLGTIIQSSQVLGENETFHHVSAQGSVVLMACVPHSANTAVVAKALKHDAVRSVQARIQLLRELDDGVQKSEHSYPSAIDIALPRRFKVSGSSRREDLDDVGLIFCDYAFADEGDEDVLARAAEILSLTGTSCTSLEEAAVRVDLSEGSAQHSSRASGTCATSEGHSASIARLGQSACESEPVDRPSSGRAFLLWALLGAIAALITGILVLRISGAS